jgi:uncharacterized spore protein YtfJ
MADETTRRKPDENRLPLRGDAQALMQDAIEQLRGVLDPKHVVGEPLVFGTTTIIPLVSVGFGFGGGSGGGEGSDGKGQAGQGGGGGGGGGGGIKPIAVVIIDERGARLEPIPEPPSGFERLGSAIASAMERRHAKEDA